MLYIIAPVTLEVYKLLNLRHHSSFMRLADVIFAQQHVLSSSIAGSATKIIGCEGTPLIITCPVGTIRIIFANFGRRSTTECESHSTTNCRSSSSFIIVKTACEGKSSCSVDVNSEALGGDPCGGVPKYLEVHYYCLPGMKIKQWHFLRGDYMAAADQCFLKNLMTGSYPGCLKFIYTCAVAICSHFVFPATGSLSRLNLSVSCGG